MDLALKEKLEHIMHLVSSNRLEFMIQDLPYSDHSNTLWLWRNLSSQLYNCSDSLGFIRAQPLHTKVPHH